MSSSSGRSRGPVPRNGPPADGRIAAAGGRRVIDNRPRRPGIARSVAIALSAAGVLPLPIAAAAQVVMPVANPDADRLAELVRRLGAAPRDLSALIEAGELSFALGDATAAAALYKRAEAIDPSNGRVKAGIARILVNGERPGEALRYFEEAQRHGAVMARYADDRGLAYDLIGEQARAQADYRLALAQGGRDNDALDEIRRRYALSLGISGRQEEALAQIDPLLRRSDRGAWRARAFILAMNGDVSGANKIATSMMPRGMAGGLAAFFQRLPSLSPVDRAFAVHFGEVTPNAARLADARQVPPLAPLATTPPRVALAAAAPVVPAPERLSRTEQRRRERAARATQLAAARAARTPAAATVATPTTPLPATQIAQAAPVPTPPVAATAPAIPAAQAAPPPALSRPAATVAQAAASSPAAPVTAPSPTQVAQAAPPRTIAPAPVQIASADPVGPPRSIARREPTSRAVAAAPVRAVPPRVSEDSILARIVAGISVPAAELGVAPMPGAQHAAVAAASPPPWPIATLEEAARTAERNAAADEQKRTRLAAAKRVSEKTVAATVSEKPEARPAVDRKTRAKEAAAEKAKKELAAKEAAEKKAERAEPQRIWVQVASGANAGDLPKAWKGAQSRAAALAGKRAYTVGNRATNRLVTGPFKTQAEARAMVNTLTKQGLSAFTFTSEPGQKMTRLDGK